jgi:HSP90 family molecular chaperone
MDHKFSLNEVNRLEIIVKVYSQFLNYKIKILDSKYEKCYKINSTSSEND